MLRSECTWKGWEVARITAVATRNTNHVERSSTRAGYCKHMGKDVLAEQLDAEVADTNVATLQRPEDATENGASETLARK